MNEGLIYVGVVVCVYIELWDLYIKRQGRVNKPSATHTLSFLSPDTSWFYPKINVPALLNDLNAKLGGLHRFSEFFAIVFPPSV